MNQITHELVVVTQGMAIGMLACNSRNRFLSRNLVERYKADITAGRWEFTGDSIKFDADGTLLDGQHRLVALSEIPGAAERFLVIRGLETKSQLAMDQGKKRTPGDQLSLLGVPNATLLAASVRLILAYNEGEIYCDTSGSILRKADNSTSASIVDYVTNTHPECVQEISHVVGFVHRVDALPSVFGAAHLLFAGADVEKARIFARLYGEGGGAQGDAYLTLSKKFSQQRRIGQRMLANEGLMLFIQAWNAWIAGIPLHIFRRPSGGWNGENYPKVSGGLI